MKYLKYALYILGGMAVLAAAVVAYVAATFDPNDYRDQLTRTVAEKTGRTLTLEGDLRLTIFPKIGVGLGRTTLSEANSSAAFASVNDLRVALAVIPLLTKRIVVDEVIIDGLRAHVVKRADGTLNIDDLRGKHAAGAAAPAEKPTTVETGASPLKLDIGGVRVTDAALTWVDEPAGGKYELAGVSLKTGRIAPGVPTLFELAATVKSDKPILDLNTRTSGTLTADFETQAYVVNTLRVQATGRAANITDLKATLTANLRAQAARNEIEALAIEASGALGADRFSAVIQAPSIVLDQGALAIDQLVATLAGRLAGADLSEARLVVPRLNVDLQHQTLQVQGVNLKANGQRGPDRFEIALDAPRLEITPDKAAGKEIVAMLKAKGPQLDAKAGVRLSALEGTAKTIRIARLAVDVDAQQADNAVKGRLSTPVSGNLETRRFDLPALVGKFDVRSPVLPTKSTTIPIAGSAGADLKVQQIKTDLVLRFDESNITAKLGMKDFARPYYTFDVAVDQLDVDRYRPASAQKTATDGGAADGGKEATFDLSALKALLLDGTLRIGRLTASKVKAANVRIDLKAKDGKLEINPLSANLYEGTISGAVSVDAVRNAFATKQTLTGVAVGALLRDVINKDLLDGRGSIGLDLSASGNTVTALKQTLGGGANLRLRDGAIKGINLGQSLRSAQSMLSAGSVTETAGSDVAQTDFSEMAASFTIRDGKAHSKDLDVRSPFLRLNGVGDIDIARGALDYQAKVTLVANASGQGGKATDELGGLTVPLRVSGPFDALKYKLDFSNAVADLSRKQFQEKKEALKQRIENQITDKLLGGTGTPPPAEGEAQAPEGGAPAKPATRPEDEIKKRLKNLLQ